MNGEEWVLLQWIKNLKVSLKLNIFIVTSIVVAFAVLVSIVMMQTYQSSKKTAEDTAWLIAQDNAHFIEKRFDLVKKQVSTMKDDLLHLQSHGLASREYVIDLLKKTLESNPGILGFYTLWEPNKFDGLDEQYRNTPLHDETGRFVPYAVRTGDQISVEAIRDYEVEGVGEFYLTPKRTKKVMLSDPYYYSVNGTDLLMTSLVLPIMDNKGEFVGIIGADISLTQIQNIVASIRPMNGYATLIAENGNYIAHGANPDQLLQPFANTTEKQAISDRIDRGEEISIYRKSNELQAEVLSVYHPVEVEGSDTFWSLETVIETKEIFKQFNKLLWLTILISVGTLVFVIIGLLVITRYILLPLKPTTEALAKMAVGDFTFRMDGTHSKDEFGQLLGSVQTTVKELVQSISGVIQQSDHLAHAADSLASSAEDSLKATKEIASSIHEVANGAESQLQSTEESLQAMEEVAKGIQHIAVRTSVASDHSRETVQYAKEGDHAIQNTLQQMNQITKSVGHTEALIKELENRSDKIGQIVTVITDIASQTNLLALNAAIEAARAGDVGRGFAVVADEVRKLAEQSSASALQISELIQGIQEDTKRSVEAMETGISEVANGVELVKRASAAFEKIDKASLTVLEEVEEVSASLEQISATSEEVTASVEALTQIAQTATSSSQNVAASSEEQLASVHEMTRLIDELNDVSRQLKIMMNQFTIS